MELLIKDINDNPTINIRWKLSEEELTKIEKFSHKTVKILIQLFYENGIEERFLYNINDLTCYIPSSFSGMVTIVSSVIGGDKNNQIKEIFMSKIVNNYNSTISVGQYYDDRKLCNVIIISEEVSITIDKNLFGKKYPKYIIELASRYQEKSIYNECEQRKYIYFYLPLKLPLIFVEVLLRYIANIFVYLLLLVIGCRGLTHNWIFSPLTSEIKQIMGEDSYHVLDMIDKNKNSRVEHFKVMMKTPIVVVFLSFILNFVLVISEYQRTPMLLFYCFLFSPILLFILFSLDKVYFSLKSLVSNSKKRRIITIKTTTNAKNNKVKPQKLNSEYLCSNKDLPFYKRSISNILQLLKSSICKPLEH